MPASKSSFPYVAGVCATLLVTALAAGPHSCGGGMTTYAGAGVIALVVLGTLPFLPRFNPGNDGAAVKCLLHLALGCGAWVAGLFIADFQILCRLF